MPLDKLSIYIPLSKRRFQLIERLQKITKQQDRSVNYSVIQALVEYLEQEENRDRRKGSKTAATEAAKE